MATRGDIRDAFYDDISSVVGTYDELDASGAVVGTVEVADDDIRLRDPGDTETVPEVVYYENYVPIEYNGVGHGPDYVKRDANGDVIEAHFRGYEEAQFNVFVRASNEARKEPIYETLRTAFGKYDDGYLTASDFHSDVTEIEIGNTDDADTGNTESPIRGDQFTVSVIFYRNYVLDVDTIQQINLDIEGENHTVT